MVLVVLANVFQYMCGHTFTEKGFGWWTLWVVILLMSTLLYMCHYPPLSLIGLCSSNSIVLLGCGESIYFENSILSSVSVDELLLLELCVKQYLWRKELKLMQKLPCFLLAELVSSSAGFPRLWEALCGQLNPPGSLSELANDTYLSPCPW